MSEIRKKSSIVMAVLGLLCAVFALEACNTMEGIGRDLQSLGSGTEKASRESRL